jgi:hypothetical protein
VRTQHRRDIDVVHRVLVSLQHSNDIKRASMLIEKATGSLWRVAATAAEVHGDLLRVPFFGSWEDEELEPSVGRC